ncbi:MAG: amino acid ABC transporter permease [Burkholderiaceae bacterium]|nr:amino acid ABC transporter permease [Burkholderiaceae bacterium]
MSERVPKKKTTWSWRSRAARGIVYQVVALLLVGGFVWFLAHNTQENMRVRGIQSGFDFLGQAAGFDIGETLIAYDPSQSYGRALWVGVLNTLRVAVIGIVLTTIVGVLVGVGRFSRNALVRGLCYGYVELFRNVPVLLQLLMWYLFFVEVLPPPQAAWNAGDLIYLSKGGFSFPVPVWEAGHAWMALGALVGVVAGVAYRRWAQRQFELTGIDRNRWVLPLAAVVVLAALGWLLGGGPRQWSVPEQLAFMVDGGASATPEFLAVLIGLVTYTGAFVAEVVRGGIQSVSHGQTEAASALGLTRRQQMRLVILPQALRVIIPPLTNQYLNLTKNSSLAVAVGYPDVVSVANTTLNQSGRAVECIAIIMLVYLTTSLGTSALMNWYNKRVAIKER